ncbi:MAG TPA: UbiA family prenyltransferase [Pyrinomonadaceae bacterium]|nr:UbiA family prenyltransferase [Pyrinomonadaceae bacterium]
MSPIFAVVYATAFILQIPIASLWPLLVLILVALVPGAAYVSVINDLTDIEDDLKSGKKNRLIGKSRTFLVFILSLCILPGLAVAFYWRNDALLVSLYLAAWVAFSLYSIPPARLKSRGVLGLLADASGAHLFPTLLVIVLVFRWQQDPLDLFWLGSVAVWSLNHGLRGNLWHQLDDLRNDEQVGIRTFARSHKIAWLHGLGNFVIFPIELAAFTLMLWRVRSQLAVAFLCIYALLELSRKGLWKMNLVVVAPRDRYSIAMLEYYEVFFPLALLLSSSIQHLRDTLILVAHLLLFPRRAIQIVKDIGKLVKDGVRELRLRWQRRGPLLRR